MTKLSKPVTRETTRLIGSRPIVLTIAPSGSQNETLLGLRLKGRRTSYIVALSDVYRMAALWHSQKVVKAKREARKLGIPWKQAVKQFNRENTI